MSEIISIGKKNSTKKSFLDNSRPLPMLAADQVYKKLILKEGGDTSRAALEMGTNLLAIVKDTKSFELDQVWEKIEKKLNDGRNLQTASKTDIAKFQTAFSLFYNILDTVDSNATSSLDLVEFQGLYLAAQDHVINRIMPSQSGTGRRNLQRALETINGRLAKVTERFNTLIDAGELAGPKL